MILYFYALIKSLKFTSGTEAFSSSVFYAIITFKFNVWIMQLRVPVELHSFGPMGDRLRNSGWNNPANNPTEQIALPSAA